jgi:hypothetical protein
MDSYEVRIEFLYIRRNSVFKGLNKLTVQPSLCEAVLGIPVIDHVYGQI